MSLFERAFEEIESRANDSEEQTIVLKGPLSELYTRALDVAYAKDRPEEPKSEEVVEPAPAVDPVDPAATPALEAADNKKPKKKIKVKSGTFHEWLGKTKDQPITDADIEKGLKSDDARVRKMAQFAKNSKKWHAKKKNTKVATESFTGEAMDLMALETQQMDIALMSKLASSIVDADAAPTNNFVTVYGVARSDMDEQTVVDVTNELVTNPEGEVVVIIDGTSPGEQGDTGSAPVERIETIGAALECIASAYKAKVYTSLKAFAESRK